MKVFINKIDATYIMELYMVIINALKPERKRKRYLMRIVNKLNHTGSYVDLKPAEWRLTFDLITTKIQALDHKLKVDNKIEDKQKTELIKSLTSLRRSYEIFKRA